MGKSFPGNRGSISKYLEGARCLLKIFDPNGGKDIGFSFRENGDLTPDKPPMKRSMPKFAGIQRVQLRNKTQWSKKCVADSGATLPREVGTDINKYQFLPGP